MSKSKSKKAIALALQQVKIHTLNDFDILCGRGNGVNNTSGNIKFRKLIESYRPTYVLAARRDKAEIARQVVAKIHRNGGRFLRSDDKLGCWYEIPNEKAMEKTCQALREDASVLKQQTDSSSPTIPTVTTRRSSISSNILTSAPDSEAAREEESVSKRVAQKSAVLEQMESKPAQRSKIDMGQEAQSARNKMLDALWKEEQTRRQRAKEFREVKNNAKNAEEKKTLPKIETQMKRESVPETSAFSVPTHRLMSPLGTSKHDVKEGKEGEKRKTADNSGSNENKTRYSQRVKKVKINSMPPLVADSSFIQNPICGNQPRADWFKEDDWDVMLTHLVAFKEENGHCAVPPYWSENPRLADWAAYNRHVKREVHSYRSATSIELIRLDRLNDLGFVWDYDAWHWERRYQELLDATEAGMAVPQSAVMEHWIRDQKNQFQDGLRGRSHLMRGDRAHKFSMAMDMA